MALPLRFWEVASLAPGVVGGAALHRAALRAAAAGDYRLADRLFETAAFEYREHLLVPALARLRVHQMMVRAEAHHTADHDAPLDVTSEIERRLLALETIEDLDPPFREVRADELLASWTARFATPARRAA